MKIFNKQKLGGAAYQAYSGVHLGLVLSWF